ncbi:hypothetical protein H920_04928 [Fukomys damarensis]|uniref:Uncharacterized protein n=1 Tax=Fukomys damarensis TaxID=885580 RepID=A0A091DTA0_FUKDA|nr:hypothetical protein H920_04928 [Fukomys damarensis]
MLELQRIRPKAWSAGQDESTSGSRSIHDGISRGLRQEVDGSVPEAKEYTSRLVLEAEESVLKGRRRCPRQRYVQLYPFRNMVRGGVLCNCGPLLVHPKPNDTY